MSAFMYLVTRLHPSRTLLLLVIFCAACLSSCAAGNVEDTWADPSSDAGPKITNIANLDASYPVFKIDIPRAHDAERTSVDIVRGTDARAAEDRAPTRINIRTLDSGQAEQVSADAPIPSDLSQRSAPDTGGISSVDTAPRLDTPRPPSDVSSLPDGGAADVGQRADAQTSPPAELCNGRDDDGNGFIDEVFECVVGRRGDTCVTTCGANGYRICSSTCRWNPICQVYPENCADTIDNDCNGRIDCLDPACQNSSQCKNAWSPSTDAGSSVADVGRADGCHDLLIRADLARLPACRSGRVIILYDSEGHPHESDPGMPLAAVLCGRLRGALVISTRCEGDYLLNWPGSPGRPVREGGIASMVLDGNELADGESLLCLDRFSPTPGVRPMVPLESFFYGRCP